MDTPRVHSGPWDQLGTAGGGNDTVSACVGALSAK
jgi:hypothetical protein